MASHYRSPRPSGARQASMLNRSENSASARSIRNLRPCRFSVRRSFDTKMLFLFGLIEHGGTIHATKLRRALRANSRADVLGYLAPLAALFEKETR
jgi:hypothetical protein